MIRKALGRLALGSCMLPLAAFAQEQEGTTTLVDRNGVTVKAGIDVGLQIVTQHNAFWNLGQTFSPGSSFDSSPTWGESYVKPYLTFSADLGQVEYYGKLSLIGVANFGTDVFDVDSPSDLDLEDAYVGIRSGALDFSLGSQPYRLGTGMLLADGGGDGFERGALIFGPRAAWEMTAIGRLTYGPTRFEAFYLDPRELESGDTDTIVAGLSMEHDIAEGRSLGIAVGEIPDSAALWVQAAPGGVGAPIFITDGRDGLQFLTAWGNWAVDERFNIAADVAFQSNDTQDMDAWAGRVQLTYSLPENALAPRFGYTYQTFSGDDPNTPELERFDPLFYDGSPAAWGSGANASLVFLNTNISAHQLWMSATLTPRDFLTFRYYHVTANELLSPLQFGQATRLAPGSPTVISGVTDSHLSDDIYVEYTRVVSETAYLTGGIGVSFPGEGIEQQAPGQTDVWPGAYLNLVMRF